MESEKLKRKLAQIETWACCDWPMKAARLEHTVERVAASRDWYKQRVDRLQEWQKTLPEPYRSQCCDILANGKLYEDK